MLNTRIKLTGILLVLGLAVGCSNDGGTPRQNGALGAESGGQLVSGGAVKGPLANADANIYEVNPEAADLKGDLLGSGVTGADARLSGLTIPESQQGQVLLEISANDNSIDLTSNAAPVMKRFRSIVDVQDLQLGDIYATPMTTLILRLAADRGDSATDPFTGDGDGILSLDELNAALPIASRVVLSTLGFGLDIETNVFTAQPLLTSATDTVEEQTRVLAYRQAIEALGAISLLIKDAAEQSNASSAIDADAVLFGLAKDLADGILDGRSGDEAVVELADISNVAAIATTSTASLMIPGTSRPLSEISRVVADEVATTGASVSTDAITNGEITVSLVEARTVADRDGDGVDDLQDAFVNDPNESVDTDGDGIGNNADTDDDGDGTNDADDALPLDSTEIADTDGDGIGNNADEDDDNDGVLDADDAFPTDASEVADRDADGIGDVADTDDDNDGVADTDDAFPFNAAEIADTDLDGVGNNADEDDDNDGVLDTEDQLPLDRRSSVGARATIGAAGGTITSSDQLLTLTIPEGALTADTEITIGQLAESVITEQFGSGALVAQPYVFSPAGLVFNSPATATFNFSASDERTSRTLVPVLISDGVVEALDGSLFDETSNQASVPVSHFSSFSFGFGDVKFVATDLIDAQVGETFTLEYELQNLGAGEITAGEIAPEGFDGTTFSIQPNLSNAEAGFVANLQHVTAPPLPIAPGASSAGSITGDCVEEGRSVVTFNIDYQDIIDASVLFTTRAASGRRTVGVDVSCTAGIAPITEVVKIPVGPGIDRVNTIAFDYIPPAANTTTPQRLIVVSDNQTLLTSYDGKSQTSITTQNFGYFGALLLQGGDAPQIFSHSGASVTGGIVEDGAFVRQFGSFFGRSAATDLVYALDADRKTDPTRAVSVEGDVLYEYFIDGASPERREIADLQALFRNDGFPGNAVSYSPISNTTGMFVTRGDVSEAWFIDLENQSGKKVASLGSDALNVRCAALAGGVTGCAVSLNGPKQAVALFGRGDAYVEGPTIPNVSTASIGLRANGAGDLLITAANDGSDVLTMVQLTPPATQSDSGSPFPFEVGLKTEFQFSSFFSINAEVGFVFSLVGREESGLLNDGGVVISAKDTDGEGFVGVIPTGKLIGDAASPVWFN